jgi:hypothetical protein
MNTAPMGNSNTMTVDMIIPCAFSYVGSFTNAFPLVTIVDPLLLPELSGEVAVEDGDAPLAVFVLEEDEETKGLVSEERVAVVRSNVNCEVEVRACCGILKESSVLSAADPWFQAAIQGLLCELLAESSLHVVPIPN